MTPTCTHDTLVCTWVSINTLSSCYTDHVVADDIGDGCVARELLLKGGLKRGLNAHRDAIRLFLILPRRLALKATLGLFTGLGLRFLLLRLDGAQAVLTHWSCTGLVGRLERRRTGLGSLGQPYP